MSAQDQFNINGKWKASKEREDKDRLDQSVMLLITVIFLPSQVQGKLQMTVDCIWSLMALRMWLESQHKVWNLWTNFKEDKESNKVAGLIISKFYELDLILCIKPAAAMQWLNSSQFHFYTFAWVVSWVSCLCYSFAAVQKGDLFRPVF